MVKIYRAVEPPGPGPDWPDVLYKFGMRRHVDAMLTTGAFRIGTLYDFRREEEHGKQIGDSGEGRKTVIDAVSHRVMTPENQTRVSRRVFKAEPGGTGTLSNLSLVLAVDAPDMHVFCASDSADRAAADKYDACIEIRQPKEFICALADVAPNDSGLAWGQCRYTGREERAEEPDINPAVLKERDLWYQHEWRLIWLPPSTRAMVPFNVLCPKAMPLMRDVPLR